MGSPGPRTAPLHLLPSTEDVEKPCASATIGTHVVESGILKDQSHPFQHANQTLCTGSARCPSPQIVSHISAQCAPISPPNKPDRVNSFLPGPVVLCLGSAPSAVPVGNFISISEAKMPPKLQRPLSSQRKQPATLASKHPPWSDPPDGERVSTPLPNQHAYIYRILIQTCSPDIFIWTDGIRTSIARFPWIRGE